MTFTHNGVGGVQELNRVRHTPDVVRGSEGATLGLNSPRALVRDSALRVALESAIVVGLVVDWLMLQW